jgi:Zn-dependent protease with chaperone function
MTIAMGLPLAASGLLRLTGAGLSRRLPPATAVRLLTVVALVAALATGFVLAVAAFLAAAALPPVAALGHWSATAVHAGGAASATVGALAGATVSVLLAAALRRAARSGWDLARAAVTCRRLGPGAGGLVVVEDDHPDAYALPGIGLPGIGLPGIGGRVVVSTAMMRALPADERRVLLAHEQAHLSHRHYLYVQLAELAAAANPLLRPLTAAVRAGVERWADEVAAAGVGDRQLAARAVARAGLAQAAARDCGSPASALRAVDGGVASRARALLAHPPRPRRGLAAALLMLVLTLAGAAAQTAHDTEHRFDQAQAAYAVASARPATAA